MKTIFTCSIERVSDGQAYVIDNVTASTPISRLKKKARKHLQCHDGCCLVYRGKILNIRHTLQHYGICHGSVLFMYEHKLRHSAQSSAEEEEYLI